MYTYAYINALVICNSGVNLLLLWASLLWK